MKLRHEINLLCGVLNASTTNVQAIEQALVTPANYSGTLNMYLEIVYTNADSVNRSIGLQCGFVVLTTSIAPAATETLYRSNDFSTKTAFVNSMNAGNSCYMTITGSASGFAVNIKTAKIIIIQDTGTDALTASESQFEIGNKETGKTNTTLAPLTAPKYYKHTAANWDGTLTAFAEVAYQGSGSMYAQTFKAQKSLDLVTWTDAVTIVNAATTSTAITRTRSAAFTLEDRYYYRLAGFISNSMENYKVSCAKIIVQQTSTYTYNDSNIFATGSISYLLLYSGNTAFGQTFVASRSKNLTKATVYLNRVGSPPGTVTAKLYAISGVVGTNDLPTGTALATSTNSITASSLSTTDTLYEFYFSSYPLIAGKYYY